MKIVLAHSLDQDLLNELKTTHPQAILSFASSLEELPALLPDAEIVYSPRFSTEHLAAAPQLKLLQIPYAGVNALPLADLDARGVQLANARIHGETISELVIGMMISLARSFPEIQRNQAEHRWVRVPQRLLQDSTIALIGVGTIGNEIARRAKAFGMRVLGFTRSGRDSEFVDESYVTDELSKQIGKADYVVVACPLTNESYKLVNAELFKAMKRSAYILNIGRGPVIDEAAMIEALRQGIIAGAALDVFEVEPLPPTSPLWDMPNVICFPHLAGNLEGNERRAGRIFVDNVANYVAKRPLLCAVDLKLGY